MGPYRALLQAFKEERISSADLETSFFALYINDPTMWDEATFHALDSFFGQLDDFDAHTAHAEEALRKSAGRTLDALQENPPGPQTRR